MLYLRTFAGCQHALHVPLRGEQAEKAAVLRFQHIPGAGDALPGQIGGQQAVPGGQTRMEPLGHGAVSGKGPGAPRPAARRAEGVGHLLLVQPQQGTHRRRRAEGAAGGRAVPAPLPVLHVVHAQRDAGHRLGALDQRPQQLAQIGSLQRRRQCGGHAYAAGVENGVVDVVQLTQMAQRATYHGCHARLQLFLPAPDRGLAPAQPDGGPQDGLRLWLRPAVQPHTQRIQQAEPGGLKGALLHGLPVHADDQRGQPFSRGFMLPFHFSKG